MCCVFLIVTAQLILCFDQQVFIKFIAKLDFTCWLNQIIWISGFYFIKFNGKLLNFKIFQSESK